MVKFCVLVNGKKAPRTKEEGTSDEDIADAGENAMDIVDGGSARSIDDEYLDLD